jgi:hypothetical protein
VNPPATLEKETAVTVPAKPAPDNDLPDTRPDRDKGRDRDAGRPGRPGGDRPDPPAPTQLPAEPPPPAKPK